jgi:hypothetical protein
MPWWNSSRPVPFSGGGREVLDGDCTFDPRGLFLGNIQPKPSNRRFCFGLGRKLFQGSDDCLAPDTLSIRPGFSPAEGPNLLAILVSFSRQRTVLNRMSREFGNSNCSILTRTNKLRSTEVAVSAKRRSARPGRANSAQYGTRESDGPARNKMERCWLRAKCSEGRL